MQMFDEFETKGECAANPACAQLVGPGHRAGGIALADLMESDQD